MPVPFPVSKVGSDKQKVEFLTISGRPKTRFSDQISAEFRNFPKFPLATNHADKTLSWSTLPCPESEQSLSLLSDEASKSAVRSGGSTLRIWI